MIDIKLLEKKSDTGPSFYDEYKAALLKRGASTENLERVIALNKQRKELITQAETAKANQNKVSAEIAKLKREGKSADDLIKEMGQIAAEVKDMEQKAAESEEKVVALLLTMPNKLNASVPAGRSAEDNQQIKKSGEPKKFTFKAKEHWELGENLGILDFSRAGKIAGSRFSVLKAGAAHLERALIQFFLDLHSRQHGYTEILAPYIANSAAFKGTGQFPKFVEEVFHLQGTDYHLIPTAEVSVTNYHADEVLKEEELPIKFCSFSPCFRSEAGAAGRDTKGLIRQHQFHKVELMIFAHPNNSYEMHELLTSHAEKVLEELELPYKRMLLCSGDIGFGSAKTYDLEVWLPGAGAYREISSCSNFEDFQARRANIRFKSVGGKPQFVHTLNGSGLAVGRTLVAVLENYQQEDGSIAVPKVLQKYMNGKTKL